MRKGLLFFSLFLISISVAQAQVLNAIGEQEEFNKSTQKITLEVPEIVYPEDGATDMPIVPGFQFLSVENADRYEMEISTSESFSSGNIISDVYRQLSAPLPPDELLTLYPGIRSVNHYTNNTTYYWRVRAVGDNGQSSSSWSLPFSYTTLGEGESVSPPSLLLPENDAILNWGTTELSWESSNDNNPCYQVQLSQSSSFNAYSFFGCINESPLRAFFSTKWSRDYYWRVIAFNNHSISEFSNIRQFNTNDLQVLTDSEGTFDDGSGPRSDYENYLDIFWRIEPEGAQQIELEFLEFETQNNYDYVTVYDGPNTDSPILGEFSGDKIPDPIISSQEIMLVRFTTNWLWKYSGWKAKYTSIPENTKDPVLSISPESGKQLETKFEISGSNFTSEGEVYRYVKFSGEEYEQISSTTADINGDVFWTFQPGCNHPIGDTYLYAVDVATNKDSNEIVQTVQKNGDCDFQWPLENPIWSNGYGTFNRAGNNMYHTGIDLQDSAKEPWDYDTPVIATADGEIIVANDDWQNTHGLGRVVILKHFDEYSLYGHLDSIRKTIKKGVNVSQGDTLGIMGNSLSTSARDDEMSPHIHFEIKNHSYLGSISDDFDGTNPNYWGYSPDLPSGYNYFDPLLFIYPSPISSEIERIIKVLPENARIRSGPGTVYSILGYAANDQKFVTQNMALSNNLVDDISDRLWYQINLPNSSGPAVGWIASESNVGDKIIEEISDANTGIITDEAGGGILLRIEAESESYLRVWAAQGYNNYDSVRVWNNQKFIVDQKAENEFGTWHRIHIPKFYFHDPKHTKAVAPPKDNVTGEIEFAWVKGEAIKVNSSTDVANENINEMPYQITLNQNYPNPFNPSTVISYQLPASSEVQLEIFDMTGRKVADLVKGKKQAGTHEITFDASSLSSGIYVYRLQAEDFVETKKLMLIK